MPEQARKKDCHNNHKQVPGPAGFQAANLISSWLQAPLVPLTKEKHKRKTNLLEDPVWLIANVAMVMFSF